MTLRDLKEHVKPAEVINLARLKGNMPLDATIALTKTKSMEVIRMVLPEGKHIAEHNVAGEISVQCLKGSVDFIVEGVNAPLNEGDWLYLSGGQSHALTATSDAVLLVTILR